MYIAIVANENSIRKENITMERSNGNGLFDGWWVLVVCNLVAYILYIFWNGSGELDKMLWQAKIISIRNNGIDIFFPGCFPEVV